jgi:hypothetical protein
MATSGKSRKSSHRKEKQEQALVAQEISSNADDVADPQKVLMTPEQEQRAQRHYAKKLARKEQALVAQEISSNADDVADPQKALVTPEQEQRAQRHYAKKLARKNSRVMRPMIGEEFTIAEEEGEEAADGVQAVPAACRSSQLTSPVSRKPGLSCVPDGYISSRSDTLNQHIQATASTATARSSSFASSISSSSTSSALLLSAPIAVPSRSGSITTPGAVRASGPPPGAEKKKRELRRLSRQGREEPPPTSSSGSMTATTTTTSSEELSQSKQLSRRTSSSGLGAKAAASSGSLAPATRPGAVAVYEDDSVQITGRSIDGKPGEFPRNPDSDKKEKAKGASRKKTEKEEQEEPDAKNKANPRGRTNRSAASRRNKRGGAASSLHSLVIGGAAQLEYTDDDVDYSDDDASLVGASVLRADSAGPSAATTPPIFQSIDMDGLLMQRSSNVIMGADGVSVVTEATEHSALTIPIQNRTGRLNDGLTIGTTSTMATARMGHTPAMNSRRASSLEGGQLPESQVGVNASSIALGNRPSIAISQRSSGVNPQMRMIMDDQGHTMSAEEMRNHWEASGLCIECGQEQTHKREKWGPFGIIRRMKPQTLEGRVYKGYCLRCHDVHDLRQLLDDPNVPMDLARYDLVNSPLRSMQENNADEILITSTRKHSPFTALCASVKFQIFCGVILIFIAGCAVGIGVTQVNGAEPFVPPPPTTAPSFSSTTSFPTVSPTSYEWNVVTEIKKDNIESFGYRISLSDDGATMAVSSPKFDGSKGRIDVFRVEEALGQRQTWEEIGEPILGDIPDEGLGLGLSMSGNGKTLAVGSPGSEFGAVRLFSVDQDNGLVTMGQILTGPTPECQFGFSVSLNHLGNRVIISAPQYGFGLNEIYGLVQAYDFNGTHWAQLANDLVGEHDGSRFGHSVSVDDTGNIFVVGAPLDDERWEDGGQIYWYGLDDDGVLSEYATGKLYGSEPGSKLGTHVAIDRLGALVVTGGSDAVIEEYPDAGVVEVHGVDCSYGDITPVGVPVSGTHEGARFGYDADLNDSGLIFIASGENVGIHAGSVRIFFLNQGVFESEGNELFGPVLGATEWLGNGPSVAIASSQLRIAVGYESILSNGVSVSEVRIYDYFAVTDYEG